MTVKVIVPTAQAGGNAWTMRYPATDLLPLNLVANVILISTNVNPYNLLNLYFVVIEVKLLRPTC